MSDFLAKLQCHVFMLPDDRTEYDCFNLDEFGRSIRHYMDEDLSLSFFYTPISRMMAYIGPSCHPDDCFEEVNIKKLEELVASYRALLKRVISDDNVDKKMRKEYLKP